jgi:hypothetical protein
VILRMDGCERICRARISRKGLNVSPGSPGHCAAYTSTSRISPPAHRLSWSTSRSGEMANDRARAAGAGLSAGQCRCGSVADRVVKRGHAHLASVSDVVPFAGAAARAPQPRVPQHHHPWPPATAAPRSRFSVTNLVVRSGLRPRAAGRQGRDLLKLVRRVGVEPTTRWLGVACSVIRSCSLRRCQRRVSGLVIMVRDR